MLKITFLDVPKNPKTQIPKNKKTQKQKNLHDLGTLNTHFRKNKSSFKGIYRRFTWGVRPETTKISQCYQL